MEVNNRSGLETLIGRLEALQNDLRDLEEGVTTAVTALQKLLDSGEMLTEYVAALTEAAEVGRAAGVVLEKVKRVQAG